MKRTSVFAAILLLIVFGCRKIMPPQPDDDELLDGPVEGLTAQQKQQFLRGDKAFNDDVFTPQNGLGPIFVASSCGTCHAADGKGHPFAILTRFGQTDSTGNQYLDAGGPQLQNRAIPGYEPEELPKNVGFSKILAPANTGLGFLDAISDATILAHADPLDKNGDGISGVPNWVHVPAYCQYRPGTISVNGKCIGRNGKKAGAYDLLQQTANAYNQDMGINTSFEPYDTYSKLEVDPEVNDATVYDVVFYLKTLKAPIQRNQKNEEVQSGAQVFNAIGCNKCHLEELKTSDYAIEALANKVVHPYTDLLLHDMGPGLDDHYTEGMATTAEWRTPALWGLGLSKNSQGGTYFLMHDGRARSIEEAILMHGGEAEQIKTYYQQLSDKDKQHVLKFLESL